jgi:hypothetical protein
MIRLRNFTKRYVCLRILIDFRILTIAYVSKNPFASCSIVPLDVVVRCHSRPPSVLCLIKP